MLENGKYGIIKYVILQQLETPETTYNFEVENYHAYYVGEEGILTHNRRGLDCNGLTRAQRRNIRNIRNNIDDHLTVKDIQAALGDVQGHPIPNLQRGDMWQHFTEVQNAYRGISKSSAALQASLLNPNLSEGAKEVITMVVKEANMYIAMLDDLFLSYGGL